MITSLKLKKFGVLRVECLGYKSIQVVVANFIKNEKTVGKTAFRMLWEN